MPPLPQKFLDRLKSILPESEISAFTQTCTEPLPKVIRVKGKGSNDKPGQEDFPNWTLSPTAVPEAFFIERPEQKDLPLGKTLPHFTGAIYSQSLSSMVPVTVLDPQPGEKILDLCAAPGSKTTFLADKMNNSGLIVANEPSGSRAKKLVANLNRLGVINTVVLQSDGCVVNNFFAQEFDRILLDAPCSSEGFGRRDNKFFATQWSEKHIFEASKLQKRLVSSAFRMLAPGGIMVYSTCTSAPEENEAVVQHLLDEYQEHIEILPSNFDAPHRPGLTAWNGQDFDPAISQHAQRFYPHLRSETWNSESFFVVKIRKTRALSRPQPLKPARISEFKSFKTNQTAELLNKIGKPFGLPKDWTKILGSDKPCLLEKNHELYLTTPWAQSFISKNLHRRIGLSIWDKDRNLSSSLAIQLAPHATRNTAELTADQYQQWLAGFSIPLAQIPNAQDFDHQQILVRHQHFGLGVGKIVGAQLKNKLDRDLIIKS